MSICLYLGNNKVLYATFWNVCGKNAYGKNEIEEEFGYKYDGTVSQS